ncbi:MAG: class I SAM-dependent methyltransferase, partial [Gammaproteobacteria bacterium]|nr:class I SAM-dependent methyltransferase [Gammaproteobacteria bacterium]
MKSGDSAKHAGLSDISKKSDDVAQYYDEWANDYNETLMDWHYEAPSKIASMLSSALSLQSSILDAGCGTGLSGNALIGAGFSSIDGINVSDRSLEVASKSGAYNTLRVMDMQRLPLDIPDD